jgi:hypothetical protein
MCVSACTRVCAALGVYAWVCMPACLHARALLPQSDGLREEMREGNPIPSLGLIMVRVKGVRQLSYASSVTATLDWRSGLRLQGDRSLSFRVVVTVQARGLLTGKQDKLTGWGGLHGNCCL